VPASSRRPALIALTGCLLLALGLPAVWWLATRNEPLRPVGEPIAAAPSQTTATGTAAPTPDPGPSVAAGPAAPSVPAGPALPSFGVPDGSSSPDDRPARVRIPQLRVDAPVDPVGVRDDGAMQVPSDGDRVGWYRFGPAPGAAAGSAVLAGHVDTRGGGLGVLFRLRDAGLGTRVEIVTASGRRLVYRVTGRQEVVRTRLPDALFARDGSPRLVLVTCGGPYDKARWGGYRDNVVVLARPA
jgi:hypothetical protein